MIFHTEVNSLLFFSLTWCMAGSFTPTGLCWMQHRPWSACSLAFLTMKRLALDNYNCTTADYDSWALFSVYLPPDPSGAELQSSSWGLSHRLLHRVHDLCGAESLHLCHSGGIQSGADTSQGNSHNAKSELSCYHYRNSHSLFTHIYLTILTAIRRRWDCGPDADETVQFVWTQI